MHYEMKTVRGYLLAEVVSALQKSIRRSEVRMASYFAFEMIESGYYKYLWRRLFTISAEDCFGIITQEIYALYEAYEFLKGKDESKLFGVKAAMILAGADKSRDADHAIWLGYKKGNITNKQVETFLSSVRSEVMPIPDCALDCHTKAGRLRGKTKNDFVIDEFESLKPRQRGLFDDDVDDVRSGKIKI